MRTMFKSLKSELSRLQLKIFVNNPVIELTLDCIVLSPAVIKQMQARPRQKHFRAFSTYTRILVLGFNQSSYIFVYHINRMILMDQKLPKTFFLSNYEVFFRSLKKWLPCYTMYILNRIKSFADFYLFILVDFQFQQKVRISILHFVRCHAWIGLSSKF